MPVVDAAGASVATRPVGMATRMFSAGLRTLVLSSLLAAVACNQDHREGEPDAAARFDASTETPADASSGSLDAATSMDASGSYERCLALTRHAVDLVMPADEAAARCSQDTDCSAINAPLRCGNDCGWYATADAGALRSAVAQANQQFCDVYRAESCNAQLFMPCYNPVFTRCTNGRCVLWTYGNPDGSVP